MEKELDILFRDTNGECATDQLLARSPKQSDSNEIGFFDSAGAVERDVPNRRKVEKIHVALDRLFQLNFRMTKARCSQHFSGLIVVGRVASVVENAFATCRITRLLFHCGANEFARRP